MKKSERLKVAVRIRPLHQITELGHEHTISVSGNIVTVKSDLHHDVIAKYDTVLFEQGQSNVFDTVVAPTITNFLDGYNCTVFTYGQTGSGKTYTMFGAHATQNPNKATVEIKQKIKLKNRFSEPPPLAMHKIG